MPPLSMRIAHIDTERTWRGGQQQVLSLIKGLNERGHSNIAVVRKGSELADALQKEKIPLIEANPWGELNLIEGHFLRQKLLRENIDLVHAHSGHGVALAALSTCRTSIPFVLTRRVDFHLASNVFTRWKYARARKIIAISEGVKKILLEDGVPAEKITIVRSGVDFSRHQQITPVTRDELGVPENVFVIGQVAALAPHKDQATLLRALALVKKAFPAVHLVLVGEGDLRPILERLAESLGLKDSVTFLGFKKDPLRYLAGFDLFCLSSREEGLGTSLLDAMALKKPVVATRAGGIPEIVEDGICGYLAPPSDPKALADTLMRAIKDHLANQEIREKGYQKALSFSVFHTILQTEAVYSSILRNNNIN